MSVCGAFVDSRDLSELVYLAYVSDLRSKFPSPEFTANASETSLWREKVIALEQTLREIQEKHQSETLGAQSSLSKIDWTYAYPSYEPELVALRARISDAQSSSSSQSKNAKKKPKKKDPPPSICKKHEKNHPTNTSMFYLDPLLQSSLPELFRSPSILVPLEVLNVKLEERRRQKRKHLRYDETCLLAIERVLAAVAGLLIPQLEPPPEQQNALPIVQGMCHVVPYILSSSMLVISGRSSTRNTGKALSKCSEETSDDIDRILGQVSGKILAPLVRSFAPWSSFMMKILIPSPRSSKNGSQPPSYPSKVEDIRQGVLRLIHLIIDTLREAGLANKDFVVSIQNLLQCLTIETLRQLDSLFQTDTRHLENPSAETPNNLCPQDRLEKLARKDTLWFLCTVLHLALSSSSSLSSSLPDADQDVATNTLSEAISTRLCGILRRIRPVSSCTVSHVGPSNEPPPQGIVMGEVEHGMILAVIEKAVLGG